MVLRNLAVAYGIRRRMADSGDGLGQHRSLAHLRLGPLLVDGREHAEHGGDGALGLREAHELDAGSDETRSDQRGIL